MREIKFRAWDSVLRRMRNPEEFAIKPNGNQSGWFIERDITPNTWRICGEFNDSPTIILMQYTGLKDKSGKEIYEGDIVKYGDDEPRKIEQVRWGSFADCCVGGETWILGPDAYQKGAIWQPAIWYHWDDDPAENTIEIIGNIYENLELLRGEK